MSLIVKKGVLLTTDVPTKQLIMFLNDIYDKNIVIKDLDDTHVLVHPAYVAIIQIECEKMHERNVFERTADLK